MIEAAKIWNEPNNKSHWDPEIDPEWSLFAEMAKLTGDAMADAAPGLTRVLGGISPIDPAFIQRLANMGVLDCVDRSEEHTSELQSLMRISYAVFCSNKKIIN